MKQACPLVLGVLIAVSPVVAVPGFDSIAESSDGFAVEVEQEGPSHSDVLDVQNVQAAVQQTLMHNASGELTKGLDLLRGAVIDSGFQSIKGKYFLARQYILLLESGNVSEGLVASYASAAKAYLDEVNEALSSEELPRDQMSFYRHGARAMLRRLRPFLDEEEPVGQEPVAASGDTVVAADDTPEPEGREENVQFGGGGTVAAMTDASDHNPIASLELTSASQVDEDTARRIFEGLGHLERADSLQEAMRMLAYGYSYEPDYMSRNVSLDTRIRRPDTGGHETIRDLIYREYSLMRDALGRYGQYSEISESSHPGLFAEWTETASRELTHVPQGQRLEVMRALMNHESGRVHWRSYRPTIGGAAEVGLGQFMPQTARGYDINPYDPQENIIGIARYLNEGIGSAGGDLREGFARYNGGPGNYHTGAAQNYANRVMSLLA